MLLKNGLLGCMYVRVFDHSPCGLFKTMGSKSAVAQQEENSRPVVGQTSTSTGGYHRGRQKGRRGTGSKGSRSSLGRMLDACGLEYLKGNGAYRNYL